jgi:mono/diheme cytochrome c family protein
MFKHYYVLISLIIIFLMVFESNCAAPSTPAASTPPAPPPSVTLPGSTPSSAPSTPQTVTAGQLADLGKTVYANSCAKCHGDNGEGKGAPAIIGTGASLIKYNTAKGLFDFIVKVMPANAPGSLSQDDYLRVLSFILVQNKYIVLQSVINVASLESINLK